MGLASKAWVVIVEGIDFYLCISDKWGWPNWKYIRWRLDTAYGASFPRPSVRIIIRDIIRFLLWRHKIRKLQK